jgi:hypothetical protein
MKKKGDISCFFCSYLLNLSLFLVLELISIFLLCSYLLNFISFFNSSLFPFLLDFFSFFSYFLTFLTGMCRGRPTCHSSVASSHACVLGGRLWVWVWVSEFVNVCVCLYSYILKKSKI